MVERENAGMPNPLGPAAGMPESIPLPTFRSSQIASDQIDGGNRGIIFRRFCALPRSRQLLVEGKPVDLGSRAFDLLIALIDASGKLVTKNEIMDRVWPSTVVSESNLRVQMVALRKALGKDRDVIKTIPGRGYFFSEETSQLTGGVVAVSGSLREAATLPVYGSSQFLPLLDQSAEHPSVGTRIMSESQEASPLIVVIDDDPYIREALHGLLRSVGLRVEAFGSVEEFLSCSRPVKPACMILDVWLPGRSGLNFHAELAKDHVRLPIIFMSGHADVPMSVQAMKAGAVEFLTKPVRHQELLNAIETAIRPVAIG